MSQQVRNVAGKFGAKTIGALLGLGGLGYATTQSFYSGKYKKTNDMKMRLPSYKIDINTAKSS